MNEQEERAKEVIKAVLFKVFFAFIPAFIGIAMIVHENIYGCSGSVGCLGGIIFYLGGMALVGLTFLILAIWGIVGVIKQSKKHDDEKTD